MYLKLVGATGPKSLNFDITAIADVHQMHLHCV